MAPSGQDRRDHWFGPERSIRRQFRASQRDALTTAYRSAPAEIPTSWSTPLHGLKATLTSLGTLDHPDHPPVAVQPHQPLDRPRHPAPLLVATLRRYLAQIAVSMRPGSVELIDTTPAPPRRLSHRAPPGHDRRRRDPAHPHRRLQNLPHQPDRLPRQTRTRENDRPAMRLGHLRGILRPHHRMGLPRRPTTQPGLRRRHADPGPPATQIPRRRRQRPPCSPPPGTCPTSSTASPSKSWPEPGSAKANSSASPATRSPRSATAAGCAPRSGNSTPTATSPCTPESKSFCSNGSPRTRRCRGAT